MTVKALKVLLRLNSPPANTEIWAPADDGYVFGTSRETLNQGEKDFL